MSDEQIKNIVIAGGGTSGWMTAASLAHHFKNTLQITLVESSEIGTIGVGEATNATIRRFYGELGLSDIDVLKATQGTCKLGIEFKNWHQRGHAYFHPFGLFGQRLKDVPFHHYWLKLHQQGLASNIADYSLGCVLAKYKKFTTPSPKPPSELSIFDWALHFDASLFGKLMRKHAEQAGVLRIDAKIEQVEQDSDSGFVKAVVLDDGRKIEGDLFIDCSGFKGLLIEQTLKTGYEDWSEWLFTDSAVAVQSERRGETNPYTVSTAHSAGWQWQIPLQHRQGNGHVYCSDYISDDEACSVLKANIEGELIDEPRMFKFTPGRRKQAWNKNVISVGLAAGFLEPLESTAIALVETAIEKIRMLFPSKSMPQGCIDEFNDMTKLEYERVRDFIILHYCATKRDDSELWRRCQNQRLPETLQHKMRLFRERGHMVKYRWEIFQPASWVALYAGNNILPSMYDQRVDALDEQYLQKSLDQMKVSLQQTVQGIQSHDEFLQQHCGMSSDLSAA